MFDAIANVGWLGSCDDLDELIGRCLCNRDIVIWGDNKQFAAVIVASKDPEGQPMVLRRHELEMAGLIVADRWVTTT